MCVLSLRSAYVKVEFRFHTTLFPLLEAAQASGCLSKVRTGKFSLGNGNMNKVAGILMSSQILPQAA